MRFKQQIRQALRRRLVRCASIPQGRRSRLEQLESRKLLAVTATYGLSPLEINNNTATVEVALDFQTTAGEMLTFFSIDLEPSSANLIAAGPDFSAFSFEPTTPLLDDWTQIGFLNDPGFESSLEYDDSLIAALPAGIYTLGTIHVDLASLGLSQADPFLISIEGLDSVIGVVDAGQTFRFEPVAFDPGSREQLPVTVSGPTTVEEGAPYLLTIDTEITSNADFVIDWGDGEQDTITVTDLPASGQVPHVFGDGNSSATIRVDLQAASTVTVGQLEVSVTNVAPTVELAGADFTAEGSPYSLLIGAVTDPGDDTVSQYVIDWGDGEQDTVESIDLPADGEVIHTYADGNSDANITVDLVDEDGRHVLAGTLTVGIENVPPTVTLSGPSTIAEGSPLVLTIGDVADPGDDTVSEYLIDWGDGQVESLSALPSSRQATHLFADGASQPTIVVHLIDEDGTHPAVGSLQVTVTNVAPTVELTGDANVEEGADYALTIGPISDPGDDTASQYIIDWGDGQQDIIAAASLPATGAVVHTYLDGGTNPTITVDVTDEDGSHPAAGTLQLTVTNVPPSVTLDGAAEVDEGTPFTLTIGPVVDPGQDTIRQYIVDWGDGLQDVIAANDLPLTREVRHTFADGPSAPTIEVALVDEDDTHDAAGMFDLTVRNVAPTVELTGEPTGAVGETYTITIGQVIDPGEDTVVQYIVDWGDGLVETVPAGSLPANGQVPHIYTDGGSTATIVVSIVDEDGTHQAAGSFDIFVIDAPPEITLSGQPSVDEGSPYLLNLGVITGPRRGQVDSLSIDWGDGTQETLTVEQVPGDLEHTYLDGPADHTVVVKLLDQDGSPLNQATQSVAVLSVAPVVERFDNSASVPGETFPNEEVTSILDFVDPGILDTHTAVIDWGDGSAPEPADITQFNGSGSASATHRYPQGGIYPITIELSDNSGATTVSQTKAFITGIRRFGGTIQLVGSEDNDIITVSPLGVTALFVNMTIPRLGNFRHSFSLAEVQGIDTYVGAGNDRVMVSERLTVETYQAGGPDDDHLQGGNGPNTVLGGPGNDRILGGDMRDLLVGGPGQDMIFGYGGDDLLLGGKTDDLVREDTRPLQIWRSPNPVADRETRISELIQVDNDQVGDTLFGGPGHNVFLLSEMDTFEDGDSRTRYTLGQAKERGWAQLQSGSTDVYSVIINRRVEPAVGSGHPVSPSPPASSPAGHLPVQEGEAANSTNVDSRLDVNQDGVIAALDVMAVVNELNRHGAGVVDSNSPYDSNGDGWLTPDDVLSIINAINAATSEMVGEGESSSNFWSTAEDTHEREPTGRPRIVASHLAVSELLTTAAEWNGVDLGRLEETLDQLTDELRSRTETFGAGPLALALV